MPNPIDWLVDDPTRIAVVGALAFLAVLIVWLIQGWRINRRN